MRVPPEIPDYPGKDAIGAALAPLVQPIAKRLAWGAVQRLMGFWTLWHLFGGRNGLLKFGIRSRSSIWKDQQEFERAFGVEVQDFAPEAAAALRENAESFAKSFTVSE